MTEHREPNHVDQLDDEDAKLVALARSARARTHADEGAAVRDTDGRSYVAVTVSQPSFSVTAMQGAIVAALSSGAEGIEAAVVVTDFPGIASASLQAVRNLAERAPIFVVHPDGDVVDQLP